MTLGLYKLTLAIVFHTADQKVAKMLSILLVSTSFRKYSTLYLLLDWNIISRFTIYVPVHVLLIRNKKNDSNFHNCVSMFSFLRGGHSL